MRSIRRQPARSILLATAAAIASVGFAGEATAQRAQEALRDAVPTTPDAERSALPGQAAPGDGARQVPDDGREFAVQSVMVEGVTALPDSETRGLVGAFLSGPATATSVENLRAGIQGLYRDRGMIFTRVSLAPSPLRDGILYIQVTEAKITRVVIAEPEGSVGEVAKLARRLARPLVGLQNPTLAEMERVLLILNDVPGLTQATAVPTAGNDGPGSVQVTLNLVRDAFDGVAFANNRQQPAYGEGLGGVVGNYNSYTDAGDSTSLTVATSFATEARDLIERNVVELNHSRYIGDDGARMGLRAFASRSRPGDVLRPLELEGTEFEAGVWGEYPVMRTRPFSLWVRGGGDYRNSKLELPGAGGGTIVEEDVRQVYAEAEILSRDSTGYTEAAFGFRQGLDVLGSMSTGDPFLSRPDGDVDATVGYVRFERDQAIVDRVTANVRAEGQLASAPLVGSEEFALGNTTFGRGYDPSESLGDSGWGMAAELRLTNVTDQWGPTLTTQTYLFFDYGEVWNRGAAALPDDSVTSLGVGIRGQVDQDVGFGLELAKPLEELRRTSEDDFRVFLSGNVRF